MWRISPIAIHNSFDASDSVTWPSPSCSRATRLQKFSGRYSSSHHLRVKYGQFVAWAALTPLFLPIMASCGDLHIIFQFWVQFRGHQRSRVKCKSEDNQNLCNESTNSTCYKLPMPVVRLGGAAIVISNSRDNPIKRINRNPKTKKILHREYRSNGTS